MMYIKIVIQISVQKTYRLGVPGKFVAVAYTFCLLININEYDLLLFIVISVDKHHFMVGSYPPRLEIQSYMTPFEEAPSGEF